MLSLYNSLTGKKEVFKSNKPNKVSMYVCGITPYDTTHLGHAFTYISFDVLIRLLKYSGYGVNYTQNVTDINDRDNDILKRAKEQNTSWQDLSEYWTRKFLDDMKSLNWIMPNNYLKASEHIEPMLMIIQALINNGYAYSKNGSVYYDIEQKKDYGKLSKLKRVEMLKIAKEFEEDVENKNKKNPLDFTLWRASSKSQQTHIPSFKSYLGLGRPGWHIECSAMSISTLGDQIDIHGGGVDLIYPHHEAEIAQSEGATLKKPFSKFWLHVAPVSYQGKKMSKSLGNLIMVSDLLKKYSPNEIRWYLSSHHYRSAFNFTQQDFDKSARDFLKIYKYVNTSLYSKPKNDEEFQKFLKALKNDLDTPSAIKVIKRIYQKKGSPKTIKMCLSLLGLSFSK